MGGLIVRTVDGRIGVVVGSVSYSPVFDVYYCGLWSWPAKIVVCVLSNK